MTDQAGEGQGIDHDLRGARRNVYLLTAAQAILGTIGPIVFSVGGVAGYQLLGEDKSLATAPLTGFNVGVALGAIFVAAMSRFLGRKAAFMTGALLGAGGGLMAAYALFRSDFWLLALGFCICGIAGGFTQKLRFAAADASPPFYKPQAISWILAGGMVSAVLGPQLVILTKDALAPVFFAGAFIALVPTCLAAIAILAFLRLPDQRPAAGALSLGPVRPLREIVLTQRFLTGMVCGISTYALMTFMMTGAPIAMVVGCGFSQDLATLGIQWHVLAMFAPSFFTGMLVSRYGAERVVAAGLVIPDGVCFGGACGDCAVEFLGRADPAGCRLELRLHRFDRNRRLQLPAAGGRHGPRFSRYHSVYRRCHCLLRLRQGADRLWLGYAERRRLAGDGILPFAARFAVCRRKTARRLRFISKSCIADR